MRPSVTAILVSFNRAEDTLACLRSLSKCTYQRLEILVVDNGSTDGSEASVRDCFPAVQVLQTGRNLGFSGGNNAGISRALQVEPDYVLLINNDTLVEPDFLDHMVDAMEARPDAGAAGGTICYYPDTERIWYAGGKFTSWRASSFSFHVDEPVERVRDRDVQVVTFITGCLMLIRASALRRVGFFDERFFMYLEDAELSLRFVEARYRLLYVPKARIYHRIQHQGDRPLPLYFGMRNRLLLIKLKTRGVKRVVACTYLLLTACAKMTVWRIRKPDLYAAAKLGIQDYFGNVFHEGHGLLLHGRAGRASGYTLAKGPA